MMPTATPEIVETFVAGKNIRDELLSWFTEVTDMYLEKKKQYGDSFSDSAQAFKHPQDDEQAANLRLFLQREYDKLKRIHSTIGQDLDVENDAVIEDALRDIVGYVCVVRTYMQSKHIPTSRYG